jgi:tetratricopeptide (TPR) repeat protein
MAQRLIRRLVLAGVMVCLSSPGQDLVEVEKLIATGAYEAALVQLKRVAELQQRTARWHLLASKAYDGLDDVSRAIEEAEAALALDFYNQDHHLQLGQIFLTHNAPEDAHEILTEALKLFPRSLLVRAGRALAANELRRYEEAAEDFSICLRERPDFGIALDGLATAYLNTNRAEELRGIADEFAQRNPAEYRAYYYGALARSTLHSELERAESLVRTAIALRPDFSGAHELLGRLLKEQGRLVEAIAALERAVKLRPNYSPARFQLATLYQQTGRTEDARREFAAVRRLKQAEEQRSARRLTHRSGR